ncbi:MAG: S8 family serine peptidase [Pirellulales bacterium]
MPRKTNRRNRLSNRKAKTLQRVFMFELLENRTLMAGDLEGSLPSTGTQLLVKSKVSPILIDLFARSANPGASPAISSDTTLADRLMFDNLGRVDVHFSGQDVLAVLESAKQIGFDSLFVDAAHQSLDGYLPVDAIPQLNTIVSNFSVGVTPNLRPMASVGAVTSEADVVLQTQRLRESTPTGYNGSGIRIGVISDSYNNKNGAATDVTSGDLPSTVTVVQDLSSGGTDEGRAMMQLAYDVAPGATYAFATAFVGGQAGFANNINTLASSSGFNADVIVDDIFYFAEPYFQDGIIAQAVDNVVQNSDVAYFSSAGNLADQAFEILNPTLAGSPVTFGASAFGVASFTVNTALDLNPGAGIDARQSITLNNGQQALLGLQWDSPFYSSVNNDIDFYLVDQATNQLVAFSAADNIGSDEPDEILGYTNNSGSTKTYEIIVDRFSGANPGRLKWINFGANSTGAINTIEYDTNSPTITPHSAAANAMSVGANPYFNQQTPESFTSLGPATILFNSNGTPATPTTRAKPDIASIDGTNNTFFGGDAEGDGRPNFFGTSAAAPHAAAVAAVVRQANPAFTASQVYSRLKQTALDISTAGVDNLTGAGLINAFKSVYPTIVPSTLPTNVDFESGINQQWEVFSNSNGRILSRDSGGAGGKQMSMDTFFGFNNSLNEAILHFNSGGIQDVQLSFDQREFGDEDDTMPATFTGSSSSDGVAMSVDGTNWIRVISLTGSNSTSTLTTRTFNLGQIALAAGLSLGSDVRVKFQQFDNQPIASDGFVFDNIVIAKAPNQPPVFGQASYTFSTPETAATGTAVGAVSATDPNLGDVLLYSLSGSGANNFVVNSSTGAITVAAGASLNAVLNPSYSLTATVSDGQVSVNVPVTLNITAVNDVTGTSIYYKGSAFAGLGVNAALDSSIPIVRSGSSAIGLGFGNLTSTSLGVSGVVLNIARMPGTSLNASDFVFRMSPQGLFSTAANPPSNWATAPSPTGIFVTPATATTPAQVRVEWTNGQIANRWLQIQVLNTTSTGLPVTQVFYTGNLQGELNGEVIGSALFVTNADLTKLNPIGGAATVTDRRDIDKNRFVLNADGVLVRNSVNAGLSLRLITIPVAGSADEGRVSGGGGGSGFFGAPLIGGGGTGNQSGGNTGGGGSSISLFDTTGSKSGNGGQPLLMQVSNGSNTGSGGTINSTSAAANTSNASRTTSSANNKSNSTVDAVFAKFDELDVAALLKI